LRKLGVSVTGCAAFMWMWRDRGIEFYKHIDIRRYLLLDSEGPLLATNGRRI
jgi:hypothetical protein